MKNILCKVILYAAIMFACHGLYSQTMENNLKVEYKIVEASQIKDSFFKDAENIKSSDELYVVGYISQDLPFKYDISCTLYFFNPGKKGLKRAANVGWVSTGKFFMVKLGSKNVFAKDIACEVEIDMRK